jgi:hypothetical protein
MELPEKYKPTKRSDGEEISDQETSSHPNQEVKLENDMMGKIYG